MARSARTDVHRPVAFDPADYDYVWAYDSQGVGELRHVALTDWWRNIQSKMARVHEHGQCDHCGARIRYVAIMHHVPSDTFIEVGETCLDSRFALASKAQFDALRKAAALDRAAQRIKTAAHAFIESLEGDVALINAEATVAFLFDRDGEADPPAEYFWSGAANIRFKLWERYGDLSRGQVEAVDRALAEVPARRAAAEARAVEVKAAAPNGKVTVEGVVVKAEWRDTEWGSRHVMTVKVDGPDGVWLAWGTVPRSLDVAVGDRVRFDATVERSDRDASFACFKRPTKASVVTAEAVAA